MKNQIFIGLLAFFAAASTAVAVDRHVPSEDYPTIQAAIEECNDGDTVLVADGTYTDDGNWDIDFLGKAITVRSENGPESCIIDCEGPHRGFYFHNGEDANSILDGFTITEGDAASGGGIYCYYSSPTITNCTISDNSAGLGGGIYCENSSPTIIDCNITGNSASEGGGIYCQNSNPIIINCVISGNSAEHGDGGGIRCSDSSLRISDCIISNNSRGGGIHCEDSSLRISDCTISNNFG
ncbi:unnamed protein product, partial [marine sediment metagenome]